MPPQSGSLHLYFTQPCSLPYEEISTLILILIEKGFSAEINESYNPRLALMCKMEFR